MSSHSQPKQQPLCPTKNPNRSTLAPLAAPFAMRTPGFHARHTIPVPGNKPDR